MNEAREVPIIDVEYTTDNAVVNVQNVQYHGILERPSDRLLALSIKKADSSRRQNIVLGNVQSITIQGQRHRIDIAYSLFDLRAVEIERIVEGMPYPDWAAPYFDPDNDKYHRRKIKPAADDVTTASGSAGTFSIPVSATKAIQAVISDSAPPAHAARPNWKIVLWVIFGFLFLALLFRLAGG